ncbi:MarC family protein [Shewanella sp. UCD-KL12]|uniref:MarC family protein n=1 Tax=Shewanella sp. UCD-KL12 TaxID=1917163 RepID=UPI0009703BDF|nr:MarC family protein [Shewanella sp. UCD-KL12]
MDGLWLHMGTVFMGFFAIMNPIANVPIFLGLTSEEDEATTKAIAFRALLLAFIIITLFSLTGQYIFTLFGISLSAFRITGGLLVFLIGFHMLQGNNSSVHHPDHQQLAESKQNATDKALAREAALSIAVSPLALPILAGPGTIATAMSFSAGGGIEEMLITIGAFGLLCAITYGFFISGGKLVGFLGSAALGAITRMMGLILAVIGTQMAVEGIKGAFNL